MHKQRAMMRGLLFGWLVGSTIGLVYAPRRGEQTRFQIRDKGQELKDGMTRSIGDARQRSEQVIRTSADRAAELIQQGQALLDEQKATLLSTVKGVQAGVQAYAGNSSEDRMTAETEHTMQPAPDSDESAHSQERNITDTDNDILDTNINI